MSKICPEKRSYWQRFFEFVSTPQPLTLRPIFLLATSCILAITFGLGMLANSPNESKSVIQLTENAINGAEASFQIGKGLLLAGLVSEALPFLDKASTLKPGKSEYAYWREFHDEIGNHHHDSVNRIPERKQMLGESVIEPCHEEPEQDTKENQSQ